MRALARIWPMKPPALEGKLSGERHQSAVTTQAVTQMSAWGNVDLALIRLDAPQDPL